MKHAPLICLLAVSLLNAADAPAETPRPRGDQPQVQRPSRDRENVQSRGQSPTTNQTPQLSGWVYIPPQGGQNGPIPPKPDFIPLPPDQPGVNAPRGFQPQPGDGPDAQPQRNRGEQPQPQVQPQVQRRAAILTPDEQHKLQEVMSKLKDDASVKEAREAAAKALKELQETTRKERETTEAAALKLDPSLAPIFEKMHAANARASVPPTQEQIQAFRAQMRDRAGEKAPTRRDEPAR